MILNAKNKKVDYYYSWFSIIDGSLSISISLILSILLRNIIINIVMCSLLYIGSFYAIKLI